MLTDDAITADFRVWQRRGGHRYSLDDVLVAREAVKASPDARRVLDLGCGLGAVLLMVAWKLPEAQLTGIEAQDESIDLARRNVARNGVADRVALVPGDLRKKMELSGGPFELITGTPPYLSVQDGLVSPDPQRAHARMEIRGGVEDYVHAAARVLAPEGRVVLSADLRRPERVPKAASEAGLNVVQRRDAIPRAGHKGPLFAVWVLAPQGTGSSAPIHAEPFVARDRSGARTEAYQDLRRFFGLAPATAGG